MEEELGTYIVPFTFLPFIVNHLDPKIIFPVPLALYFLTVGQVEGKKVKFKVPNIKEGSNIQTFLILALAGLQMKLLLHSCWEMP